MYKAGLMSVQCNAGKCAVERLLTLLDRAFRSFDLCSCGRDQDNFENLIFAPETLELTARESGLS